MTENLTRDIKVALRERVVPAGGTRHGLVVGIGAYRDARLNLRYARADAEAIHGLMIDPECGMFPPENVQLLVDDQATRENVRRALAALRRKASEQDTVWVYYAGHAAPEEASVYWVTHDTEVDDLYTTGLADGEIHDLLGRVRARQMLVLLDCCHAAATSLQRNRTRAVLAAEQVFAAYRGEGRLMLASSDGSQKSVELGEEGHGAFTWYLEKGFRGEADKDGDGVVSVEELWDYLRNKVSEAARRVGNEQTPVLDGTLTHGIALTLNPIATRRKAWLADNIKDRIGIRPDQLTTDEAQFCLNLLSHGVKTDGEQQLVVALESLAAGRLEPSMFKFMVSALRQSSPGPAVAPAAPVTPSAPATTGLTMADVIPIQTRAEAAWDKIVKPESGLDFAAVTPELELIRRNAEKFLQHKAFAEAKSAYEELLAGCQAALEYQATERRCREFVKVAQQNVDSLIQKDAFEQAGAELRRLRERTQEVEVESLRREFAQWIADTLAEVERLQQAAAERYCRKRLEAAKQRVATLERAEDYDAAIAEVSRLSATAPEVEFPRLRGEWTDWLVDKHFQLQAALRPLQEANDRLYEEAQRLLHECRLEDVIGLLAGSSATPRDQRLRELLAEARQRLATVAAIQQDLQAALSRREYDGLLAQLQELERSAPLTDQQRRLMACLTRWEQLPEALRLSLRMYRDASFLEFQRGDDRGDRLARRLQSAVEAEGLWATVRDTDADDRLLSLLQRILTLNPDHREASRRIKPLYGRRNWNVCKLAGHPRPVYRVSFSTDGRRVMTRDDAGGSKIWSLDTLSEVTPRRNQVFQNVQVCVSPLGDYALSGFKSSKLILWDAVSGKELGWLEGHTGSIFSISFSPDGRRALSVADDRTLRVWDLERCRPLRCYADSDFAPAIAGFSVTGEYILAGGRGSLRVWSLDSDDLLLRFQRKSDEILNAYLGPQARFLIWIERTGQIAVVHFPSDGHLNYIGTEENSFSYSADGKYIVTGNTRNLVTVWDAATCQPVRVLVGHRYSVNSVVFSPDGSCIASGSDDETIRLWDTASGALIRTFTGHRTSMWQKMSSKYGSVKAVDFSPNGRYLASGSQDGSVQIWYAGL